MLNDSSYSSGATDTGFFYWFDRNSQSKLFNFEDGYLNSAKFNATSPFYAVHASVSNLHFLSIHTKAKEALSANTEYVIAEFPDYLPITTASHMGVAITFNGTRAYMAQVKAKTSKEISITPDVNGVPTNSFITCNIIWIDSKTTANDTTIYTGTTGSQITSSDKFCKYLSFGRFRFVQVYGYFNNYSPATGDIAVFNEAINTPDAESCGPVYGNLVNGSIMSATGCAKKRDLKTFYLANLGNSKTLGSESWNNYPGYGNYSFLWFA